MKNYRLYRIDGAGSISTAEWLEAADDDIATEQAAKLCVNGASVEIWARNRLVARLGPRSETATTTIRLNEIPGAAGGSQLSS